MFFSRSLSGAMLLPVLLCLAPAAAQGPPVEVSSILKDGDRVAWIGSSSTHYGVWTDTVEFLLHTRQPGLDLDFSRHSTGGGTFDTGLKNLDRWLDESRPTVVIFNYGANDAAAGRKGLPKFLDNMDRCVAKVNARPAPG